MSSTTRGNRNPSGTNSNSNSNNNNTNNNNSRGNGNRRYGNGPDRRQNNGPNSGGSNNQQRGWGSQNLSSGSGGTLNTRGIHQQRTTSGGGFSPADLDAQKHMHDRTIYLLTKSIGCFSIVTVATGARYKGILAAASTSSDIGVVLEFAEKYASAPGEEDDSSEAIEKFDKIVFQAKDLVDIVIESPNLTVEKPIVSSSSAASAATTAAGSEFKTDTDISGQKGAVFERELQRWSADEGSSVELSLEDTASSQHWDQFAVNQNKFGVQSTYDEHLYTTVIDRSHPDFQQRERRAEQIAGEILKSSYNGNVHLAEERGIAVDDSGMDEEDKYSGVDRRTTSAVPAVSLPRNPNKYTPPALRPPTNTKNNKGVPYDPAIISSSLATSDGSLTPRAVPLPSNGVTSTGPSPGGTSTPISDLFKASQGVTTASPSKTPQTKSSQQPKTTSSPSSAAITTTPKPIPPSVALPASARAVKLNVDKDSKDISKLKGSGKVPTNTEGIQKGLAGDFKEFVSTEMEKVQQKKQYLHFKEKSDRIHDFKKFSQGYKINTPVPIDLVPILGKKRDVSVTYSKSPTASKPTGSVPTSASSSKPATPSSTQTTIQPALPVHITKSPTKPVPELSSKIAEAHSSGLPPKVPSPLSKQNKPVLSSPIPKSVQPSSSPLPTTASSPATSTGEKKLTLNFKAPEFRPNPAAHSFTPSFAAPGSASSSSHASPAMSHSQPAHTPRQSRPGNLFFGNKTLHSKTITGKFNPFLQAQEDHKGSDAFFIERSFVTPPTWPTSVEKSYTEFLPTDNSPRSYYSQRGPMGIPPPSPALAGGANMVPIIQPGFEDPNLRGMMSTPPIPGQVAFIPGMAYSQYGGAPQFFGRAPQPFPIPNMMGQAAYMSFNPQQGFQSPRGTQAMLVPAMNQPAFNMTQGYYSPQQQHQQPFIRNGGGPGGHQNNHQNNHSRYNNSRNSGNNGHYGGGDQTVEGKM